MKNLKKIREKLNITQVRLSTEIEVSQETISAYESGKALPSADVLIKIAKFLNTSVDYLLGLTDNPTAYTNDLTDIDELLLYFNKLDKNGKNDVITYAKVREKIDN